jgi:hypothetical protein
MLVEFLRSTGGATDADAMTGLDAADAASSGILSGLSSSSAMRLPRRRRDLGGSGLILGLMVALIASVVEEFPVGWASLRLGVMTPGFSCWLATSCTLIVEHEAGSRSIPRRCTALALRCASGLGESDPPSRVGDRVPGELPSVLVGVPDSASVWTASVVESNEATLSLCDSDSSSRNHSTVAHRRTNLLVVSSTSSKCNILSRSPSLLDSWPRPKILSTFLSSSRL